MKNMFISEKGEFNGFILVKTLRNVAKNQKLSHWFTHMKLGLRVGLIDRSTGLGSPLIYNPIKSDKLY